MGEIQVTATRLPEAVDRVPASVTVIRGEELRARGAVDLRSALSLVAGVEAPPGGDAGPASAVPSLWGLHEFDAFLLVVDGVPWGGAFNPSIPTLDLNDVERIEVLRGAAPVAYGATAFVGVIQVIHYPAGHAASQAQAGYGSYGSAIASGSAALPQLGGLRQSIAASGERRRFADHREQINNGKALYRGAAPLAGGALRIDADVTVQRAAPPSPAVAQGAALVTPLDANYNPADARIDEHKYHFVLGYTHETPLGELSTIASYAHSKVIDVRGFLRPDFNDPAAEPDAAGDNADYQRQDRGIIDSYFDTHFHLELPRNLDLVYGADLLYGSGKQTSTNGAYCAGGAAPHYGCAADQNEAVPQPTARRPVDEINGLDDRRAFFGEYLQLDWKPDARWDFLAGLRLNQTHERNTSTHVDTADSTNDTYAYASVNKTRLSGMAGASYRAWISGEDEAVVYVDWRNTFKPAAIDFGPDVPYPAVLAPETARSYEGGLKGRLLDDRLDYDASVFFLHFNNLVVPDAGGQLHNAGSELFKGFELEARYRLAPDLKLALNYSYHGTRIVAGEAPGDDGRQLALSPHSLASAGLLYAPPQGCYASVVANYVGNRFLDPANSAPAASYITVDATLGYRWRQYFAAVHGYNLSDRRDAVTNSEFGESSFYRLPARSVMGEVGVNF
ncbi:MAG: TonB-dependent receptor [Nevskia sp.]|nr:TonB-dependent receptor [Nevskia sp.]